jgi:outer membrane protein assembly factor BamB
MTQTLPVSCRTLFLAVTAALLVPSAATSADWIHWRGPMQNGVSLEKNLPAEFDPSPGGNVIWKAPFGGRSAPLVMGGRVFILQGTGTGLMEGEQVVCVDEATGKPLWTYKVNVFHSDIVSSRLGWAPMTADPDAGYVYCHTTGGLLLCLDKDGKLIWQRSLTEEFGRVTGYGGRIPAPIFDEGLVIAPMVNSSWGDFARGGSRFAAFDGKTGQIVWWSDTGNQIKETFCANPVIAVINGQRLLICGGADGYLHALKVRTGEKVWSYPFSAGAINCTPIVSGNLVYANHGDDNPEGGPYGRIICVDAGQIGPMSKRPKLVWEHRKNQRFGLAAMALDGGILYAPEDFGDLYGFDAKTGTQLWKVRYAREVRSSPLIADGKLYIFDVQQKMCIFTLNGKKKPDLDFELPIREPRGSYAETNGTCIAVNGHLYFTTGAFLYCVGEKGAKAGDVKYPPLPDEAKFDPTVKPTAVHVFPADVAVKAGETVKFTVKYTDGNGRDLPAPPGAQEAWSIVQPPPPPGKKDPPPPLRAELKPTGELTLDPKVPGQQGYVAVKAGDLTARTRVRVVPQLGYAQDFDKVPEGGTPGGWVNTVGKYTITKLPDGNTVLAKVNTNPRPPIAKAIGYITPPDATDYTVQANLMGHEVRGILPDMGLVNSRYTFVVDGKVDPKTGKRTAHIGSWEGRPRIYHTVEFDWQPGVWYAVKFTVEPKGKTAVLRGKIWKKGEAEPEKWTAEFNDPNATTHGAAGVYGYTSNAADKEPGAQSFYDNVTVTPNKK